MQLFDLDLVWPIVGALVAGGVIGAEREFRASPAGFRTHILVSLSSALLMLAAVHQIHWLTDTPDDIIRIDPVRMAHGVITGIGFLCGGVIFREGFTVRGVTTAASLWSTSSLGVLFGVGFFGLALLGMLATVLVLTAVNLTGTFLPQRQYADIKVRYRRASRVTLTAFRSALVAKALHPQVINQDLSLDTLEFSTTVSGYSEAQAQALAETLEQDPALLWFECLPHKS